MAVTSKRTATVTLPADEQILITREFDAPRDLVYKAWTTPELVKRWWSAKRGEVTTAEIDLRVGGAWRYAMVTEDGFEVAFHGEYREIVSNERIVSTEVYEGMPDAQAVDTVTFAEADGRTTVTILIEHTSKEHRDAHIDSGMEDGLQDALDLLEEVATSLPRGMTTSTRLITGVDFVSVPTRDLSAAIEFYGDTLGLQRSKLWQRPGQEPVGAEFETGTVTIALMDCEKLGVEFQPSKVPIALRVDDVRAARAELESRGVSFDGDIIDSGVCHQALFEDPDGNSLDLHHRYAPPT
jgi:uncharacterized protein YndB with AHSA1/START domain/catechol 2,3-dioxygenase-like lactoylglutathione lyase family enzyme